MTTPYQRLGNQKPKPEHKEPERAAGRASPRPRSGGRPTRRQRADLHAAEDRALELFASGLSYRRIGQAMGVAASTAFSYVDAALGRAPQLDGFEALRWRELEQLDELTADLLARTRDQPDTETVLRIVDRIATLTARRYQWTGAARARRLGDPSRVDSLNLEQIEAELRLLLAPYVNIE